MFLLLFLPFQCLLFVKLNSSTYLFRNLCMYGVLHIYTITWSRCFWMPFSIVFIFIIIIILCLWYIVCYRYKYCHDTEIIYLYLSHKLLYTIHFILRIVKVYTVHELWNMKTNINVGCVSVWFTEAKLDKHAYFLYSLFSIFCWNNIEIRYIKPMLHHAHINLIKIVFSI